MSRADVKMITDHRYRVCFWCYNINFCEKLVSIVVEIPFYAFSDKILKDFIISK